MNPRVNKPGASCPHSTNYVPAGHTPVLLYPNNAFLFNPSLESLPSASDAADSLPIISVEQIASACSHQEAFAYFHKSPSQQARAANICLHRITVKTGTSYNRLRFGSQKRMRFNLPTAILSSRTEETYAGHSLGPESDHTLSFSIKRA